MLTHHYGQSGNAEISLTIAREAFQLAPTLDRAIVLLARAELRNGSGEGAVERLLSLAGDFPKSAGVAFELARAHVVTREMSFARQGFERVLVLDENHVGAKLGLGRVALSEAKPERAIEIARQFQQSYPERVEGFALEGDAQLSVPNPDAAIIAYKAAFALQRLNRLVLGLSRAHLANGDVVKARETLNIWLREHPDDVAVRTAFADFALTLGEVSTAISRYERIVEQFDDQVGVLNNLAYLYHQRNDDRALGLAKKAYSLAPTHPGVLDTYGWLLVENGEANRGLPILQRSVERSPKNGEHRYHLGVALAKVSRHKEARAMLLSVVKMDGDFPEKEKAAELLGYLE
jgi:putative PEP-CTERM system TPR-repeat lipoprotein